MATTIRIKEQGKLRFLGINESVANDPKHEILSILLPDNIFNTIMVDYNLLNQTA